MLDRRTFIAAASSAALCAGFPAGAEAFLGRRRRCATRETTCVAKHVYPNQANYIAAPNYPIHRSVYRIVCGYGDLRGYYLDKSMMLWGTSTDNTTLWRFYEVYISGFTSPLYRIQNLNTGRYIQAIYPANSNAVHVNVGAIDPSGRATVWLMPRNGSNSLSLVNIGDPINTRWRPCMKYYGRLSQFVNMERITPDSYCRFYFSFYST